MPTYVYRCQDCQKETEVLQRFGEAPLTTCSHCGGVLQRILFPPAIIFKGSGWYATDHKSPSGGNGAKSGSPPASKGEAAGSTSEKAEEATVTKKPATADEV